MFLFLQLGKVKREVQDLRAEVADLKAGKTRSEAEIMELKQLLEVAKVESQQMRDEDVPEEASACSNGQNHTLTMSIDEGGVRRSARRRSQATKLL